MFSCPNCGAEFPLLYVEVTEKHGYDFDYQGEYEEIENGNNEIVTEEYSCPKCGEVLTDNEKDALKFNIS